MANAKKRVNSVITSEWLNDGTLKMTVRGAGEILFDPTKAHADMRGAAERNGWLQRLSDKAALSRDAETGASATPQEKFDAIQALAAHYESGVNQWSLRVAREGAGDGALTLRAVARVYGYDLSVAGEKIDALAAKKGMDRKALLALLRGNEKVRAAIDAIRAESAKASDVDTEELLGELGAGNE